jgi:hypothetical protein
LTLLMNTAGRTQTSGNHLVDADVDLLDLGGLAALSNQAEMAFLIDMFCSRGRIDIAPLIHVELAQGGLLSSTRPAWRTNALHVQVLNYRDSSIHYTRTTTYINSPPSPTSIHTTPSLSSPISPQASNPVDSPLKAAEPHRSPFHP